MPIFVCNKWTRLAASLLYPNLTIVIIKQLNFTLSDVFRRYVRNSSTILFFDPGPDNSWADDNLLASFVELDVWDKSSVNF